MALFKPMVGASKAALDGQSLVAGYVWFTTNDGKFYIDWEDKNKVLHRSVLNAGYADTAGHADSADTASTAVSATSAGSAIKAEQDSGGNVITSTYLTNTNAANTYATITTVNGKAPTNHASTANTYGVGSTSNYGHIKIGSNISVTDGVISLSKANVTAALGFTPISSYTDTKNTAGSTNTSSKIFLIGATSQAANPQTYSHDTAYVGTDGYLYSNSTKVSVEGHAHTIANITNLQTSLDSKSDYTGTLITPNQEALYDAKICKILLPNSYADLFLEFHLSGRSDKYETVKVWVQKSNSTAISNRSIRYFGEKGNIYSIAGYLYTDSTNGDYLEIWCKVSSWDYVTVTKKTLTANYSTSPQESITWYNTKATLPTTSSTITLINAVAENWAGTAAAAATLSSTLTVAKGGTGLTAAPSLQVNLGSTSAASIFAASPRPGVTGTLAIGNGGTGATTAAGARTNLSACGYTTVSSLSIADFTSTAYLPLTGGTLSGQLTLQAALSGTTATFSGNVTAATVNGAVWNDYAEYRAIDASAPAGYCVVEKGNDELTVSTRRLEPAAYIVSDTFGFSIGKTAKARCPVAVAGRVLAYPFEDRDSYKPGDPVCAAPGGRVSKMTRKEAASFPDRIIGIVSAVPDYETWGENEVKVNGRIWIKVK